MFLPLAVVAVTNFRVLEHSVGGRISSWPHLSTRVSQRWTSIRADERDWNESEPTIPKGVYRSFAHRRTRGAVSRKTVLAWQGLFGSMSWSRFPSLKRHQGENRTRCSQRSLGLRPWRSSCLATPPTQPGKERSPSTRYRHSEPGPILRSRLSSAACSFIAVTRSRMFRA